MKKTFLLAFGAAFLLIAASIAVIFLTHEDKPCNYYETLTEEAATLRPDSTLYPSNVRKELYKNKLRTRKVTN